MDVHRTGIKITCNLPPAGAFPSSPQPQVFNELDVSRAEASVESDRVRILDAIRSDVGDLNLMTHRLKNGLVAGAVAQVPPAESEWTEDVDRELHIAARLSQLYGRLAEAEPLYRRALEMQGR